MSYRSLGLTFLKESIMSLFILMSILIVLALGGAVMGHSRYTYWSWSPAALILMVAVVLFFTGHLSLHR